jgi:hypothetical protein
MLHDGTLKSGGLAAEYRFKVGVGVFAGRTSVRARRRGAFAVRAALEREALPVLVAAVSVLLLALLLPLLVGQDTWLSLVDGRLIAHEWLPRSDTLTAWTVGRPWIDQQWGAHVVLYELAAHGGVAAAAGLVVACVALALLACATSARALGASPRSTAVALLLPVAAVPWLAQIRAQSLALLPFAVVYGLLALDARRPGRRVLFVLPVLAVWANLHGSVVLGAGLVCLYGSMLLCRGPHRLRGATLAVAAPLCVFASPYGFALGHYYHLMLVHPAFASFIPEWRPAMFGGVSGVFFLTAFATAALWGGHRRHLTGFEQLALGVLLIAALQATRSAIWFELALAISVPRLLDSAWPTTIELTPAVRRLNLALAAGAVTLAAVVLAVRLAALPTEVARAYPADEAATVSAAAGPGGLVLADARHADWLLWLRPELAGRIAYDVRFELFDRAEIERIAGIEDGVASAWRACGAGANVVTFARDEDYRTAVRERVLAPGARTVARDASFRAVRQPVRSSGTCAA